MSKRYRNILLLVFPFLIMVIVNESVRLMIVEEAVVIQGVRAINSAEKIRSKCSWICHNETAYCKANHVKFLHPYFEYTDTAYFGIINTFKASGNYSLMNIVVFVLLLPFLMFLLLVKSLDVQEEIKHLKSKA